MFLFVGIFFLHPLKISLLHHIIIDNKYNVTFKTIISVAGKLVDTLYALICVKTNGFGLMEQVM